MLNQNKHKKSVHYHNKVIKLSSSQIVETIINPIE